MARGSRRPIAWRRCTAISTAWRSGSTKMPITPQEAESFQTSSYADGAKGGKQRTMAIIMFCPGGGKETASAAAVKSIDLNTNHARSPMAGIQRVVEAPRDFKVEKMTGEVKPGGTAIGQDRRRARQDDVHVRLRRELARQGCGGRDELQVDQFPSYSSCRRHQKPCSLRPRGARSSHWYMPQRPSSPRAYAE